MEGIKKPTVAHSERRAVVGTVAAVVAIVGAGILHVIEPDAIGRGVRWVREK